MNSQKSDNQKQLDSQSSYSSYSFLQQIKQSIIQSNSQSLHQKQIENIQNKYQKTKQIILKSHPNFRWQSKFNKSFQTNVLKTDFQSMRVQLSYGNFILQVSIIMAELLQAFFVIPTLGAGKFGEVFEIPYKQNTYAVKSIRFINDQFRKQELIEIYQQYFLCCLAESLGVGPRMHSIFGYDLIITKNRALFVMEKCQKSVGKLPSLIEKDLMDNLNLCHSIGFMHLDVKPSNIAFSIPHNRHVLIDFGLSRLIDQKPGQKTLTGFVGTLSYCSEQMKKCFFLQKKRQVDLYFEDQYAVKKTIEALNQMNNPIESSFQQIQMSFVLIRKDDAKLFQGIIPFFELKYNIFEQNIPNILQLIHIWKDAPKTFCNILQDENINQEIKKEIEIIKTIKMARQSIIKNDYNFSVHDEKFSNVFTLGDKIMVASKILPISEIIELQSEKLALFLNNDEFAFKLYKVFNPFDYFKPKYSNSIQQIFKYVSYIIRKIYMAIIFQNKEQPELFFCQRVRRVLIYFYQKLKNYSILCQLRMLFVALHDIRNVEKLQENILEVISDESLKALKILQFQLGWNILGVHSKILHSNIQQLVIINKQKYRAQRYHQQISQTLQKLICDAQSNIMQQEFMVMENYYQNQECRQTVSNIKQLYIYCKQPKLRCLSESFVRLIYSVYSDLQYKQINYNDKFGCFWKVFKPLKFQYREKYSTSPNFKLFTKTAFEHLFYDLESRKQYITISYFWQRVNFTDHYLLSIENLALITQCFVQYFTQYGKYDYQNAQHILRITICLLKLSYYHLIFEVKKKMPILTIQSYYNQQFDNLLEKIEIFTHYFIKKCQQQQKGDHFDFESDLNIIGIALKIMRTKSLRNVENKIREIFVKVSQMRNQGKKISFFFLFVLDLGYEYTVFQEQKYSFIFQLIYQFGNSLIQQKQFSIFQYDSNLFPKFIHQLNLRKQYKQAFQAIMSFITFIDKNKNHHPRLLSENSIFYGVEIFIKLVPNLDIILFNQQTIDIPSKSISGLQGFFIFKIFEKSINQISSQQKRIFLNKFLLIIKKMPNIYIIQVRIKLMQFYRKMDKDNKSRKKLSNARRQFRFSNQKGKKVLSIQIKNKINKIYKRSILKQLGLKIQKFLCPSIQQSVGKQMKN